MRSVSCCPTMARAESRPYRTPQSSGIPVPLRVTALAKSGAAVMLEATGQGTRQRSAKSIVCLCHRALASISRLLPRSHLDYRSASGISHRASCSRCAASGFWTWFRPRSNRECRKPPRPPLTFNLSTAADGSLSEFTSTAAGPTTVILTRPASEHSSCTVASVHSAYRHSN